MHLVSVEQMISMEKKANAAGLSYAHMMRNAGLALAKLVGERFATLKDPTILGLVGSGNNGGDTLVALTELAHLGWKTFAYLVKARPAGDDLIKEFQKTSSAVIYENDDEDLSKLRDLLSQADVLLDGVFGTGIKLPLADRVAQVLKFCQEFDNRPYSIAVDCPSGVDCVSGIAADECIPADLTVCMEAVKKGLLQFPAFQFVGEVTTVDIGLPDRPDTWDGNGDEVLDARMVSQLLPPRPMDAHKGTFGTSMIVAGSTNYCGTALLAGKAAYRIGAGLVRIAIPGSLYPALAGHLPEATWLLMPHSEGQFHPDGADLLINNLGKITSLLLGPGWGIAETTQRFLEKLLTHEKKYATRSSLGFMALDQFASENQVGMPPIIVDADGLKLLAKIKDWPKLLTKGSILTPHTGEMAVLTGLDIPTIQAGRMEIARSYALQWGHIVVLKGALTIVAHPDGYLWVVPVATPGLARAGTGDVLAGMIAGLCAQGLSNFNAAAVGAWVHAQAGVLAAEFLGSSTSVLAEDVIEAIPQILSEIENKNRRW